MQCLFLPLHTSVSQSSAACGIVFPSSYNFSITSTNAGAGAGFGRDALQRLRDRGRQVSTRILGRRMAPFPPFLIPSRVPRGLI